MSGKVVDEKGNPQSSVTVLEKGTQNGTSTNNRDEFTLRVSGKNSVLVFAYVGYNLQEMAVGNNLGFSVKMLHGISQVDEVVVIGYGSSKKRNLVGAVDLVSAKEAALCRKPAIAQGVPMEHR